MKSWFLAAAISASLLAYGQAGSTSSGQTVQSPEQSKATRSMAKTTHHHAKKHHKKHHEKHGHA